MWPWCEMSTISDVSASDVNTSFYNLVLSLLDQVATRVPNQMQKWQNSFVQFPVSNWVLKYGIGIWSGLQAVQQIIQSNVDFKRHDLIHTGEKPHCNFLANDAAILIFRQFLSNAVLKKRVVIHLKKIWKYCVIKIYHLNDEAFSK